MQLVLWRALQTLFGCIQVVVAPTGRHRHPRYYYGIIMLHPSSTKNAAHTELTSLCLQALQPQHEYQHNQPLMLDTADPDHLALQYHLSDEKWDTSHADCTCIAQHKLSAPRSIGANRHAASSLERKYRHLCRCLSPVLGTDCGSHFLFEVGMRHNKRSWWRRWTNQPSPWRI